MKINRSALLKFSLFVCLVGAWMLFGREAGAMEFAPLGLLGGLVVETGIDWDKFAAHRTNPKALESMGKLITGFFQAPLRRNKAMAMPLGEFMKELARTDGKFTVSDANLFGRAPIINVYSNTAEEDFGYERVFDFVDMRSSKSKTFEIMDVTNSVTFEQIKEGEPIKVRAVSSAKTSVGYLKYGAGLGFLDDWFRFNDYYLMDDIVKDVRRKYYDTMSTVHYGLFTALSSGVNEAFATDDVTTINNACASIIKNTAGKGLAIGENPAFKIVCGVGLKARLAKAIAAAFTNPNGNNSQIVYRIDEVIATPKIADTSYYVTAPGVKMKRAVWDDLNAESQRDALRRAEDFAWEGKFNAAIGEISQVRRCALS